MASARRTRIGAACITAAWLVPTMILTSGDAQGGIALVVSAVVACAVYCGSVGLIRGAIQPGQSRWNGWALAIGLLTCCLCVRAYVIARALRSLHSASNPNADEIALVELHDERDTWYGDELVSRLAANPSSPAPLLETLFAEEGALVHFALATNPNTPSAILRRLGTNEDELVKRALRRNPAYVENAGPVGEAP